MAAGGGGEWWWGRGATFCPEEVGMQPRCSWADQRLPDGAHGPSWGIFCCGATGRFGWVSGGDSAHCKATNGSRLELRARHAPFDSHSAKSAWLAFHAPLIRIQASVRPCPSVESVRYKMRLDDSETEQITIFRCSLSFAAVV